MKVLVTGAAGFIGFHTCQALLARGVEVTGIDNLNAYYDVQLKQDRLALLRGQTGFEFAQADIADDQAILQLFAEHGFSHVIHLAAQAGVRYSLEAPFTYTQSNITGQLSILEACRQYPVEHLLFASSSSVYGLNSQMPFSTSHHTDHPVSLYAATKKSGEMMTHSYSHLYGIPATGLRFFTVYGPWGRPDMALFKFTDAILHDRSIDVYNHGDMQRDFTYVGDVVNAMLGLLSKAPTAQPDWDSAAPSPEQSSAPYRIMNIGKGAPVRLGDFIEAIEAATGKTAIKNLMPIQPGDVLATYADSSPLQALTGVVPDTPLNDGVAAFVDWYRDYYKV